MWQEKVDKMLEDASTGVIHAKCTKPVKPEAWSMQASDSPRSFGKAAHRHEPYDIPRVQEGARGNDEEIQITNGGVVDTSGESATQPAQIEVVPATEETMLQSADGPLAAVKEK